MRSKLNYWGKYGAFAGKYVQSFDDKWILRTDYSAQTLLGSPDIQSLADMRQSYAGISENENGVIEPYDDRHICLGLYSPGAPVASECDFFEPDRVKLYTLLLK